MKIRSETSADHDAVRQIHALAFGQVAEGALVDRLRAADPAALSLVAELDGRAVGHVLFTRAWIEADGRRVEGMGLAPLAVLPEFQRQGLGSALSRAGLELLREREEPFVVVLGHPDYYPRFGFEPAGRRGLSCKWPVPEGVFQVIVFDEAALAGVAGRVLYRPEFDELD